ncbi:lamin tail domain-containing protein [candidate division KSB1 bacterium]|nr:lamin tail domain-containing protein [candidate division KSB1 bacterium]
MHRLFILLFLCSCEVASAQVILSEVMYNPRVNDNAYEFIEIFNASAADTISLFGWQIGDQAEVDSLISPDALYRLAPQQFAVALDPGYFLTTGIYDSLIPSNALILTINDNTFGSGGLSNSTAETVVLVDAAGNTVARYTYSLSNADGISDEKILLNNDDSPGNWANSLRADGTPGALNSVSRREIDLAAIRLWFDPPKPRAGDDVQINAVVLNRGRRTVDRFVVTFANDRNQDGVAQGGEEIGNVTVEQTVPSEDSVVIRRLWIQPPAGRHHILAILSAPLDTVTSNDRISARLSVGYGSRSVVINEIYYAPNTGEAEWVEFYNRSSQPVDLSEWRWRDASAEFPIMFPDSALIIAPGEFALLAAVRDIARADSRARLIVPKTWLTLNNDRDRLVLADFHGRVQDSLSYLQNWGGQTGVSLERINPHLAGADSSNWSGCVDPNGSTPGWPNSIFTEFVPSQATVTVSPQPFSPDSDGHDDAAIIQIQVPATTATAHLKIYDVRGRLVHQLLNNSPIGATHQVVWNGRDAANQPVPMGLYIVYLQAIHATGGILVEARTTLVLARKLN